jgi:uncharacterized protein
MISLSFRLLVLGFCVALMMPGSAAVAKPQGAAACQQADDKWQEVKKSGDVARIAKARQLFATADFRKVCRSLSDLVAQEKLSSPRVAERPDSSVEDRKRKREQRSAILRKAATAPIISRMTPPTVVSEADKQRNSRLAYDNACNGGSFADCMRLGEMARDGLGGLKDRQAAEKAFSSACDGGVGAACTKLAESLESPGWVGAQSRDATINAIVKGCDVGDEDSCAYLAYASAHLSYYRDDLSDQVAARQFAERDCAKRGGLSCSVLSAMLLYKLGGDGNLLRGEKLGKEQCAKKDYYACGNLAIFASTEKSINASDELAMLEKGCYSKVARACFNLATILQPNVANLDGQRRGAMIFQELCAENIAAGCFNGAGLLYDYNKTGKPATFPDTRRAKELLTKGCNLGDPSSCYTLGELIAFPGLDWELATSALDRAEGQRLFGKSCDEGLPWGCRMLGFSYYKTGNVVDRNKAREFFQKACTMKPSASTCADYGSVLVNGIGGMIDYEKGVPYLDDACKSGSIFYCNTLGDALAAYDPKSAKINASYKTACDSNIGTSCAKLGARMVISEVKADKKVGIDMLTKACNEKNDGVSCDNLSQFYFVGHAYKPYGLRRDAKAADRYARRACTLKNANACRKISYPEWSYAIRMSDSEFVRMWNKSGGDEYLDQQLDSL